MSESSMIRNFNIMDTSSETNIKKTDAGHNVHDILKADSANLIDSPKYLMDNFENKNKVKLDKIPYDGEVVDSIIEKQQINVCENFVDKAKEIGKKSCNFMKNEKSDIVESEVGIVGPEATAKDILNDEELSDGVSKDIKHDNQQIATWIVQSSLHNEDSVEGNQSLADRRRTISSHSTSKTHRIIKSIIKRSIKCLNKVQQMDSATTSLTNNNGTNLVTEKVDDTQTKDSSTIPQSRQNGNTFSDETAMPTEQTSITLSNIKKEIIMTDDDEETSGVVKKKRTINDSRKRQTTEDTTNRNSKRIRYEQRERYIDSLVGCDRITTAEELECRAEELVAEVKALDELARAKEMEWNEILSMRKLKEEAYLRLERRRQIMGFLEGNNGQRSDNLPAASLTLASECEGNQHNQSSFYQECQDMKDATGVFHGERSIFKTRSELKDNANQRKDIAKEQSREESQNSNDKYTKNATDLLNENRRMSEDTRRCTRIRSALESETSTRRTPTTTTSSLSSSTPLSAINLELNADGRHIGEGRQGPIVDVRSIIADHRLRNPENVPRRGRRMRNSVNIGLGAGGAMVETGHGDSRPSSTDSCKSNPTNSEAVSFKDVLVQFAKLSQQQGEPVKTPQNYPDVTLHPVAPSPVSINPVVNSGPSGSLLHGILTKNQNTGPTTFSPTLARLLTAPEKERGNTTTAGAGGGSNNNNSSSSNSSSSSSSSASSNNSCVSATLSGGPVGQMQVSQNLLPSYQSSNPVSITDLLSSSKTRTEITITPVNSATQPSINSNSILHSDHVDEEHLLSDGRDSRRSRSNIRDHREDRDAPPRCQGCNDRAAQFVCAGCGNQWYCSRECQVSAWDEHSEVCSG